MLYKQFRIKKNQGLDPGLKISMEGNPSYLHNWGKRIMVFFGIKFGKSVNYLSSKTGSMIKIFFMNKILAVRIENLSATEALFENLFSAFSNRRTYH